jgi:hypothetical protein
VVVNVVQRTYSYFVSCLDSTIHAQTLDSLAPVLILGTDVSRPKM